MGEHRHTDEEIAVAAARFEEWADSFNPEPDDAAGEAVLEQIQTMTVNLVSKAINAVHLEAYCKGFTDGIIFARKADDE